MRSPACVPPLPLSDVCSRSMQSGSHRASAPQLMRPASVDIVHAIVRCRYVAACPQPGWYTRYKLSTLPNTCASDGREYTHLSLSALSTAHSVPQILTHVVHSNCVPAVTPAGTVRALPVPSILQWSAEHHAPTPTLTFLTRCMCRARPLCTRRTDRALFLARARTRACACHRRSWPSAPPECRSCRTLLARRTPRAYATAHPRTHRHAESEPPLIPDTTRRSTRPRPSRHSRSQRGRSLAAIRGARAGTRKW